MKLLTQWVGRLCTICLLTAALSWGLAGCQRELEPFDPKAQLGSGLDSLNGFGAILSINDSAKVRGCVDTAFIQNAGALTALSISVFDTSGRFDYVLSIFSTTAVFQPGTYAASQGQSTITFQVDSLTYVPATSGSDFSIQLLSVTDSLVVGVYSGTLVSLTNPAQTIRITNGAFRAYLNRPNPCTGAIPVLPPAVYVFAANPQGGCTNFVVNGVYTQDSTLTAANTVTAEVNVTTPGSYAILVGPKNGYRFQGAGVFTATGVQNITLEAVGKPLNAGSDTFFVSQGTFTCQLVVPVEVPVVNAPCAPAPNTAQFQAQTINFDSVRTSTDSISFIVRGIALGGTLRLAFRDSMQPGQNFYNIVPQATTPFLRRTVKASIQVGPTVFDATQGTVYVQQSLTGGIRITLCNVSFGATIGGQPVNGLGSARMDLP